MYLNGNGSEPTPSKISKLQPATSELIYIYADLSAIKNKSLNPTTLLKVYVCGPLGSLDILSLPTYNCTS